MILIRLGIIAIVLFLVIFGFLRLCFTKGYLNRERLNKWNRNIALTFVTLILVVAAFSFFADIDKNL